jgi:glycosyltransferase involved in cell wall biosynthesis
MLRLWGYSHNRGKGFALKCAVKHATGDVVIFMDSDADINPDLIEQYVALLRDNDHNWASASSRL